MKNIVFSVISFAFLLGSCPEGFYEDLCGDCMDNCTDYVMNNYGYTEEQAIEWCSTTPNDKNGCGDSCTSDDGGVKEDIKKVYEDILEESTKPKRKKFKYGILSSDHDLFYKVGTNIPTQLNEVGDFYQEGVQVGGSIFKPLLASDGSFKDSAVVGTAGIGQDKGLMSKNIGADVGLKYVQGGTSLENPDLSAGIGYDVDENKAYAEVSKDIGTYSIPKTPFKLTPNIAVKYSEGGDWNINPNLEFSFKSGGLLDRKRS